MLITTALVMVPKDLAHVGERLCELLERPPQTYRCLRAHTLGEAEEIIAEESCGIVIRDERFHAAMRLPKDTLVIDLYNPEAAEAALSLLRLGVLSLGSFVPPEYIAELSGMLVSVKQRP